MSNLANINRLLAKPHHWGWVEGLYLAGNDDGVAMRLLDGQTYEPQSRQLWKRLCKEAELVIDVGAHTGIYTLDAWEAGAKDVLSIEPYYLNHARLMMNLRHAGYGTQSCVFGALSDENRYMPLSVNTQNYYCSAGGRLDVVRENEQSFQVKARCLDTLLKKELHAKVKVIKIDTEKHGLKVLRGMPRILSHHPHLILECTEEGLGAFLKPLGYKFYLIDETSGLKAVDDLIPANPFSFNTPNRYATVDEI